ncbi:winged helix-turn-helix transcriptional regulator [Mucilaginibacter myungsuensis]|uniref:Winged helix-turn-helix transcriptional regulator n=2 Tax=Mucilaginibacter myungsuensis TaxID=649104 RepID=A0A929L225_9SPHI|nr:winged helix-turn-helix transcriptional regulator [Mucilaginibacter myungsuensis]
MRKEASTNFINEKRITDSCGMANTMRIMGGRWKPAILCRLMHGTMRYNELKKSIEGISERMLVAQLRELENDGIIARVIYPEVPPRVEYHTTDLGKTMHDLINAMAEWGHMYRTVAEQKVLVQEAIL